MQWEDAIHCHVLFLQDRKIFTSPALGNRSWLAEFPSLLSPLSVCSVPFTHTRCREPDSSPKPSPHPPRTEKIGSGGGGRRYSSAPARKRGLGGLLFLLSDSIYMGSSSPGCLLCCPDRLWGAVFGRVENMVRAPSPWRPAVDSIRQSSAQKVSEFAPRDVRGIFGIPAGPPSFCFSAGQMLLNHRYYLLGCFTALGKSC